MAPWCRNWQQLYNPGGYAALNQSSGRPSELQKQIKLALPDVEVTKKRRTDTSSGRKRIFENEYRCQHKNAHLGVRTFLCYHLYS